MSDSSRRQFLTDSLLAAAAAAAAASPLASAWAAETTETQSKSPNEKLGIACIGVNGRGESHLQFFGGRDDTEVVVICDADSNVGEKRCDEVAKKQNGRRPKYVQDMRKVFDDKSVDCVTTATPNHWHALTTIWALQAGKDVYCEKPASHNVSEGRRMVEAARKYNRICQLGTQSRSAGGAQQTIEFVKNGGIGEVKVSRGLCYKRRDTIGPAGDYAVPSNIDYNLWRGPAPMASTSPYRGVTKGGSPTPVHYDWHWNYLFGNGDLGNQGIHQMDIARWGLGVDTLPMAVISYGGRLGYEDAGNVANTQVCVFDFGPKTLVFEVRGLKTKPYKGAGVGNIIEGTNGYAVITDNYSKGAIFDPDGKEVKTFNAGGNHFANFLKAVRSRKKEDLNADIETGHLSSALCHLGNISYRLGKKMPTTEISEKLAATKLNGNSQDTLDRTVEHLSENSVKLDDKTQLQCGELLKFDPKTEKFVGNEKADAMLTREYRAQFTVPAEGKV
jgi:predicted dehydrogenase